MAKKIIRLPVCYGCYGCYGDMIRIALFVGRINEEGIGVAQIRYCVSCPRNPGSRFFSLDGEVYPPFIEPRIAGGPSASMGPLFLNPYPTTVPSISFAPGVTF